MSWNAKAHHRNKFEKREGLRACWSARVQTPVGEQFFCGSTASSIASSKRPLFAARPTGFWGDRRSGAPWRLFAGEDLSCKVRYRTFPWFFSQMSKLYRARSLLYRRQILQVNIRWKTLDEIYKIYITCFYTAQTSIFQKFFVIFFSHFLAKICKNSLFLNSFHWFLLRFWWNFVGISPII